MISSSEKHLEKVTHAHIVGLKNKLKAVQKDMMICQIASKVIQNPDKLTNKNTIREEKHVLFTLKDVFSFAEHQGKATYGLRYKLTMAWNVIKDVLSKAAATIVVDANFLNSRIDWYVPHYAPNMEQQARNSTQISSKFPIQLRYSERTVFLTM